MQINDGTEPRQDEQDSLNKNVKLGENDLENFSVEQLGHISKGINASLLFDWDMSHRETLYAFRITLHNAINKVKLKS
jgi:hypothetical protein